MHRLITGAPKGVQVDHKDFNGLNNTRENMRLCDNSGNQCHQGKSTTIEYTSRFKGVCWDNYRNKWRATIRVNDKWKQLGRFEREVDAAIAYNTAAAEGHGEYAVLNVIPQSLEY